MNSPFFYSYAAQAAQDLGNEFLAQPENLALSVVVGGAAVVYGISKLDTIKSMFAYFIILLAVCFAVLIIPQFQGTGSEDYAEKTLQVVFELGEALIQWVWSQVSSDVSLPARLFGGLF